MRFIECKNLKVDMVVAEDVINENGILYLKKGQSLTNDIINKLVSLTEQIVDFEGIFVSLSEQVLIKEKKEITNSFKEQVVKNFKQFFEEMDDESLDVIKENINEIVNNILNNKDVIYNMVDLKIFDEYTYHHSVNVSILSIIIGYYRGLDTESLNDLGLSAILHDIGKLFIPDKILNKKTSLEDSEYKSMQEHVLKGYFLLKDSFNLKDSILNGILDHHEKWNGTGYPNRKKGNEISLFGQIIAVADVYDAMTSNRPYREPLKPHKIYEYILSKSEEYFSYEIIKIFASRVALYPVNSTVILSNNMEGIVLNNHFGFLTRPTIQVDNEIIHLKENWLNVTITDCTI